MELTHEKITIHAAGSRAAEALKTAFLTQATVSFGPVTFVVTELADGPYGGVSARLTEFRQLDWAGEGLPPVGTVCEVLWGSQLGIYVSAAVLAHDEAGAVYRFTTGERKGEYQSEQQDHYNGLPKFRPIRTPEQIAAEERREAIAEIAKASGLRMRDGAVEVATALYAAGYRKQVAE